MKKAWLFVILAVIIFAELTVLNSFFYPIQTEGFTYNNSIVEIGKMVYASGWVSVTIAGPSGIGELSNGTQVKLNPIVQFPNGTQVIVNSTYTFQLRLPRTGDCFCNGGTSLFGNNGQSPESLDQSHPIVAAVVANASSFLINGMPRSGCTIDSLFQYYWFIVQGDSSIYISGYGVAY